MATSRHYEEEQGARPKLTHRVPGHLEDFVLDYPSQQLAPRTLSDSLRDMQISDTDTHPRMSYQTSTPERHRTGESDHDVDRLRKMEQCVWDVQQQVRILQSTLQISLELGKGTPRAQQSINARSVSLPLFSLDIRQLPSTPERKQYCRHASPYITCTDSCHSCCTVNSYPSFTSGSLSALI